MAITPAAANVAELEAVARKFRNDYINTKTQIKKAIVGHEEIIDGVLTCLFAGGHALLEGVPGLGKTLLIKTLSEGLDLSFSRVQFTPDLMPADIIGSEVLEEGDSGRRTFRFINGPVFAQLLMADEINRASPRTQSALLQAMQERHVTVAGVRYDLPQPFHVLATQILSSRKGPIPFPKRNSIVSSCRSISTIRPRTPSGGCCSPRPSAKRRARRRPVRRRI